MIVFSTILAAGSLSAPKTQAFGLSVIDISHIGTSIAQWGKNFAKETLKNAAKNRGKILRKLLAAEIRKMLIKEGTFVTNWRNYQRKNQDAGAIIARGLLGEAARGVDDDSATAVICAHLRDSISDKYRAKRVDADFAAISRAFRVDSDLTFKLSAKCTLPEKVIVAGIEKAFSVASFSSDFEGGFAAFEKLLEPQNNYVGLEQLTKNEFVKQRTAEENAKLNDAIAGNGFLSLTNKNGQIKTPGKILQDTASNLIDQALTCFETADSWTLVATCANNLLVKQLQNFRDIGDEVGLLDDETADETADDEPIDQEEDVETACIQMATESAHSYCDSMVLGTIDIEGVYIQDEIDLQAEIAKYEKLVAECGGSLSCVGYTGALAKLRAAAAELPICKAEQTPRYIERMECANSPTPLPTPTPSLP